MSKRLRTAAEQTASDWRELGFYYDFDGRLDVNQWRFYGSPAGLDKFVQLLDKYLTDPRNATISEHEHYGPYMYFEIMTWSHPQITDHCFAGSLEDLRDLRDLVQQKLVSTIPGETFEISNEYGIGNNATARFFVMSDEFDPASIDELIVSGRQEVVNSRSKARDY